MAKRAKAPSGCVWRGDTLYADFEVHGQRIRQSLETGDAAIAKRRVQALRERAVSEVHGDAQLPLAEVILNWGKFLTRSVAEGALRPTTQRRYLCSMEQLIPYMEGKRLRDIDTRFVNRVVEAREKRVTNATIKRDLGALSSLMRFAKKKGLVEANPVLSSLEDITEGKRKIDLPRLEDIELALGRAPDMIASVARVAKATGARLEELITARRDQIDHDRKQLMVVGKGDKRRTIDLTVMDAYSLIAAVPVYIGSPFIFWHGQGRAFHNFSSNFRRDVTIATAEWAKANGIEFRRFRFHDLRHWHAVMYLKEGWGSVYELKERLGHAGMITTEHYLNSGYLTGDEILRAKYGRRGGPFIEPERDSARGG
jgi:integrase/recombinase XerD